MKTTQISNYGYQLTRLSSFNCFLIQTDDQFTLIDTGLLGSATKIMAAAETLGKQITTIIVTHAHQDHAASLDDLVKQLGDVNIVTSQQTSQFLAGDMSFAGTPAKLPGSYIKTESKPSQVVGDNEMLGPLKIVTTPGHTPGHISVFDTRDRTLYAGDAFQTKVKVAVAGDFQLLFPFPALATWNKSAAVESARKLTALEPLNLSVGHGNTIANPTTFMENALLRAANK